MFALWLISLVRLTVWGPGGDASRKTKSKKSKAKKRKRRKKGKDGKDGKKRSKRRRRGQGARRSPITWGGRSRRNHRRTEVKGMASFPPRHSVYR